MTNVRSALTFLGIILAVILALAVQTEAQDLTEKEWWEDTIVDQIFQDSDGDGSEDLQEPISYDAGQITGELDWWQSAAIYQIYSLSFQDSNGDGVGDLQGIISRLDYLKNMGFTGFTLTPIYSSPRVDGGYDISDFTEIDPIFGSFEDFQELVDTAHEKNLKVILDFVPNHSSDQHVWFQNSVAGIEPYTDYYVWRDGNYTSDGTLQPPNNWLSVFGGSAWTWNAQRQQYYLHQFHTSQPDLNFRNPAVLTEMTNILRFWLDQRVDGFRVSSAAHLFEDANFPDEPLNENPGSNVMTTDHDFLQHVYTADLDETIELVSQWRTVVDEYAAESDKETRILITDSTANIDVVSRYFGNETHPGAHLPLNFAMAVNLTEQSTASICINTLNEWFANLPEHRTSNWILESHNHHRIASRFGLARVDGVNMLHLLPGVAFTYMGEELGLTDTEIEFDDTKDPHAINAGPNRFHLFTRDPARTPYQWDNSTSAGFSTNTSTWLPINGNYLTRNLAHQSATNPSNFNFYKSVLELRQTETIKRGATRFLSMNDDRVVAFTRELEAEPVFVVVVNFGLLSVSVNVSEFYGLPSEGFRVCLASSNSMVTTGTVVNITEILVSTNAAVVVCNAELPETTTSTTTNPTTTITSGTTSSTIIPITTTTPQPEPEPEPEPDTSEEDIIQTTTEYSSTGATAHVSSLLLVISLWSILL